MKERNSRHSPYNFEQLRTSGSRLSRKRTCHASEQYSADAKFIDRSFGWVAVILYIDRLTCTAYDTIWPSGVPPRYAQTLMAAQARALTLCRKESLSGIREVKSYWSYHGSLLLLLPVPFFSNRMVRTWASSRLTPCLWSTGEKPKSFRLNHSIGKEGHWKQ